MSARRVAVEVYLGYKEEISQEALEHKKFGWEREERNASTYRSFMNSRMDFVVYGSWWWTSMYS